MQIRSLRDQKYVILTIALLSLIPLVLYLLSGTTDSQDEFGIAPDFVVTTIDNETISLNNLTGEVIVLHFTNVENPVCIECEKELKDQAVELAKLSEYRENLTIITINMRRNPSSESGRSLAEEWWGINISWYWIEDFSPYPISSTYVEYWTIEGATANPTIILVNETRSIVGLYHVYQMGKGGIDGVQNAQALGEKVDRIESGEWAGEEGEIEYRNPTYFSMFLLGIITSFTPCSIAMLIAVLSFTMTDIDDKPTVDERSFVREGLLLGIAFTMGMSIVFLLFGLFISSIGDIVRTAPTFYLIAGMLLFVFGINNIVSIRELISPLGEHLPRRGSKGRKRLSENRPHTERLVNVMRSIMNRSVVLGGFLLGVFFAIAWAPCAIALVLPVAILMFSHETTVLAGGLLFFSFGLGHGIPVIPMSTVSRSIRGKVGERYIAAGKVLSKAFGVVLIILGIIFAVRYFGIKYW